MELSSLTYISILLVALFNLTPGNHRVVQERTGGVEFLAEGSSVSGFEALPNIPLIQERLPYTSKEGRFSITLPPGFSAFRHKTQIQPTGVGDVELHIYNSESSRGACIVGHSDYPPATFVGRTSEQILEDARDGALKSVNGTLEKQKKTIVQGYPALSIYGSLTSGTRQIYFRFDYVLVQPRAYQIGHIAYARADIDGPDVQNFFKSFRVEP